MTPCLYLIIIKNHYNLTLFSKPYIVISLASCYLGNSNPCISINLRYLAENTSQLACSILIFLSIPCLILAVSRHFRPTIIICPLQGAQNYS